MQKKLIYILLTLAFLCFSSGCADSEGASASDARGEVNGDAKDEEILPLPLEEYAHAYWGAVCAHAFSCCSSGEILAKLPHLVYFPGDGFTEEVCLSIYGERAQNIFDYNQEAIESGRLIYHADNAAKCVRELQDASCDAGIEVDDDTTPSCELVFDGLVENGEECGSSDECRVGRCDRVLRRQNGELIAPGTCLAPAELGGKCAYYFDCLDGNICKYDTDSENNADFGTCQKPAQLGEACRIDKCVDGTFCEIDRNSDAWEGICRPLKGVGEPCDSHLQCDEGTLCLSESDGERICIVDHCKL